MKQIGDSQKRDKNLQNIINYLKTGEIPEEDKLARTTIREAELYHIDDDDILYHHGKYSSRDVNQLVVPVNLQSELTSWYHDHPCGGHFGILKTYEKLCRHYYWRNMYKDIEAWTLSCLCCNQRKSLKKKFKAPLLPIPVQGAWDIVAADCLSPFPTSLSGNKYIVVFGCLLTKYVEAFAVSTIEAAVISQLLIDKIIFRHGMPRKFLTDRGSNFLSKMLQDTCGILNIKKISTSSYHPQTDGFIERINGVIAQTLSMYVASNHKDWDTHLPAAVFA